MENDRLLTCNKCGWVHFGVSKEYIEKWKKEWQELCQTKDEEWLECYGIKNRIPPSDAQYYRCFLCQRPHTNMRDYKEGDCPTGCTIQPILCEEL